MMLTKVSKLLIAAEKGKMHSYKGKSLIDISVEELFISENSESDSDGSSSSLEIEPEEHSPLSTIDDPKDNAESTPKIKRKKRKTRINVKEPGNSKKAKMPWTEDESNAIKKYLSKHFLLKSLAGKKECLDCMQKSGSILNRRNWKQVKYFVYNRIHKK